MPLFGLTQFANTFYTVFLVKVRREKYKKIKIIEKEIIYLFLVQWSKTCIGENLELNININICPQ